MAAQMIPISKPMVMSGWLVDAPRAWKNTCCSAPELDLAEILGGLDTTLGRVSRMDVRLGISGEPDSVKSQ